MTRKKASRMAALIASLALVAIPAASAPPAHAAASGTLICSNGQAIQGIWVEAVDPAKRGWANRWIINGTSSQNGWSHAPLNAGDPYYITVGCGSWSPTYISAQTSSMSRDFICVYRALSAYCYDS